MATLSENITQAITAFDGIKQAIADKGVDVPQGTPVSGYADKIRQISGGGTETGGWKPFTPDPDWNWWDVKAILQNDVQDGYQYKVIELLYDSFPTETFTGAVAYKTSDGAFYTTGNIATAQPHTWNTAYDRQSYRRTDGGLIEAYKTRYVIKYYSTNTIALTIGHNCPYFVIDRAYFTNSGFGGNAAADSKKSLISFDLINGAALSPTVTTMSNMFYYCCSLQTIPPMDTSKVTNMGNMFYYCYSLQAIPPMDASGVLRMDSMFYGCYSLQTIPLLNMRKTTNVTTMFNVCYTLSAAFLFGVRANITISSAPYLLSRDSILYIIRNRDMSVTGTITLTIGADNIAKLTTAEKAEAATNRITLA